MKRGWKLKNLILVSALLPVTVKEIKRGEYEVNISPGGLITTLVQSVKGKNVRWFGWYGFKKHSKKIEELIVESGKERGLDLQPVSLSEDEVENFFNMFSNGVIWSLFHTFVQYCRFNEEYWHYYKKVNEKFAQRIIRFIKRNTVVWVHDYHFFLLPQYIKSKKKVRINFFLHIPFPSPELFLKLPWRKEIIDGMLSFDFIGFHTEIDKRNFIESVRCIYPVKERKHVYYTDLHVRDKRVRVASIPISIDFKKYEETAKGKDVESIYREIRKKYKETFLILSIDRIDYTKGLVEKLNGYKRFLEKYPEYRRKTVMLVSTAPNIKKLPEYELLEKEFHHRIAEINGTIGTEDWRPVLFINKRLSFNELIAYYRASDICFITPIRDGLNIVCKEYAASNLDLRGAIILSEFAGASTEIGEYVYLVNPYDTENMADTIKKVLEDDKEVKRKKMEDLREHVSKFNIYWWSDTYFKLSEGKGVEEFPLLKETFPLHETK